MIHTERTKDGVTVGMSGAMRDIITEATIALSHILKHVPTEQRVAVMAEISYNALANVNMGEGEATVIEDPDVLNDAIKKMVGGEEE